MDLPATYYGDIDERNPVIVCFERDIKAFANSMKRVASSSSRDNVSYTKGIKTLVDLWRNYKHRLPSKLYQQSMLRIADFLAGLKMFRLALWQGYSLHLHHFSTVNIIDIADMEHFMVCYFPQGFDADGDIFDMKVRAMLGCAQCIFEQEKKHSADTHALSQNGLSKLLQVLNFLRSMMQAFQRHEHLSLQLYNGTLHIYNICRYLMTMNYSGRALEYLLWASISLELSVPLKSAKYVPWISTLYCAVCQCYYDNQAAVQAEKFARRGFEKIMALAEREKESGIPSTRETQKAYKEGSIKLVAMIFKWVVFETRRNTEMPIIPFKTKSNLKDIPHGPWPCTAAERLLSSLFDSSAAQFLGILEALWDSSVRPLQTTVPEEPEMQEVVLELVSAGISILYGVAGAGSQKRVDRVCLRSLTSTSSLMELACTGENKIPIMSAVRFTKIVFQCNQPDVFSELAREIQQVLSTMEGHLFRKAELELLLLESFNSLHAQASKKTMIMEADRHKVSFTVSDDFIILVDTLHKSVCGSAPEAQPDEDLVLDIVLFLWSKLKLMIKNQPKSPECASNAEKVVWCLSMLCEVAFACDLATVDCMMTAQMIHSLAILLESAAEAPQEKQGDDMTPPVGKSCIELLQEVCDVVERGLKALAKGVASMLSCDFPTAGGSAAKQSFGRIPSALSVTSPMSDEGNGDGEKKEKEEAETKSDTDVNMNVTQQIRTTSVSLLATDILLELDIIHHRASLKLLQLNAVAESDLLDRIKKNQVSKAHYLIQKALVVYNNMEPKNSSKIRALLKEATALIEKAEAEERKMCLSSRARAASEKKDKAKSEDKETPPPPPLLLSRTDHSFIFAPAPYHMEAQVSWYQLCGCVAEGINLKVRLGDCSLPGTGNLVPARHDACPLKVDGLEPNKKYVFAVAAYDSQGILLGKAIGETTFPLLASTPPPLLSTWAHLAQVAFQTEQYAIAKRACGELWNHYTTSDTGSHSTQDRLATTGLHMQAIQCSTPQLCQLFLTSIFIETAINIQQESLYCDSDTASAFFIWEQEARLAECERMLVATDLALWLDDRSAAVHAVISCYGLLAPLIFHQSPCVPVVQVLTKCLIILEENVALLRQKWNVNTRKSIIHMIACITYYLSGALHIFKEHQKAAAVMDCGRTLLQDACDAPQPISRFTGKAHISKAVDPSKDPMNTALLLRALRGKNKRPCVMYKDNVVSYPQTDEESATLHERITNGTLKEAYQSVMKLKQKARFIEFGTPLLHKALREGRPDLALKWGRTVFKYLYRSDRVLVQTTKKGSAQSKHSSGVPTLMVDPIQPTLDDTRKKSKLKTAQRVRMNKEVQAVRRLLTLLSMLIQRRKRMHLLRSLCTEERMWKSHLNFSIAQSHVTIFYRGFEELHGAELQYSYRQMNLRSFSLAYSGILVQQRNWQPLQYPQRDRSSCQSSLQEDVLSVNDDRSEVDSALEDGRESYGDEDDSSQFVERHSEKDRNTSKLLLDSLKKASLHFQRAMVLAHRGCHWTTLQNICQTVWEQSCRISTLGQMGRQLRPPSLVTTEELGNIFTPLLVTAIDLIMDMLDSLGMWSLYDNMPEDEIESGLHFSAKLDDSTQVDMHWVRNLVLHTLEQLHDCGKWESLAHFAIYFNTYTSERYAWIVTPLLILAQRKLIERISTYGGSTIPQPHYMKTQMATGQEITCRDYKECQLLSGWIVNLRGAPEARFRPPDVNELRESEKQRSLSLVRVPLDVEDTMRCYRQALEKRPHYLQVLQHGRSLLLLLLAHTQSGFASTMEQRQSRRLSRSASAVDFCPIVTSTPNVEPTDLTEEDYNTPNFFYNLPLGPGHIPTVIAAYSSAIRYLKVNRQESLRILVLHEMGNLQFYSGNKRAAHLYWNRAIGNALQSTDVLERWDGVSFGDGSLQQTLRRAGIWGCLQAAVLTAKIAQYLITSDISQRTKMCLLSAHLFKCVLCCSLAQPQSDLEYASHSVGDQLLPGVDLFSELFRAHIDTTIGSLNFICQWLLCAGYHIKVLPILALYLHFVGTVCRDVQRTVEGKILKIHALTQLCLFTDAVKEVVLLTQGDGVLLPTGYNVCKGILQPIQTFCSNKSLLDNTEALEELVNCDFAPELCILCGPTLLLRFELARVQLVLALSSTIHVPPLPDCLEEETSGAETSEWNERDGVVAAGTSRKTEHPKVLSLDLEKETLTPEMMKFRLLEGAAYLLHSFSQKFTSQAQSEIESLELELESNLLKVDLYLQQRHALLSSEVAISSMVLLQASQVILRGPVSEKSAGEQDTEDYCAPYPLNGECTRAVEASERIGAILWLRCCVALVRSLAAQIFDPVVQLPGKNVAEEAARVLRQGLDVCVRLGDVDTRALLMYEGAQIEAQRGRTGDSIALLQGAVRLLQGRTYIPSGSNVILAQATLLLSKLKGTEGTKLLKLTQKLVQKQLCVFGENVVVDDGKICVSPSGPDNIYLPYFQILYQTV